MPQPTVFPYTLGTLCGAAGRSGERACHCHVQIHGSNPLPWPHLLSQARHHRYYTVITSYYCHNPILTLLHPLTATYAILVRCCARAIWSPSITTPATTVLPSLPVHHLPLPLRHYRRRRMASQECLTPGKPFMCLR